MSWERTPQNLEMRRRAMRALVVAKLRTHPELLAVARESLNRWQSNGALPRASVAAWRALLDAGLPAVLELLEDTSESRDWLRRCAPMAGVLTEDERLGFLRNWRPPA